MPNTNNLRGDMGLGPLPAVSKPDTKNIRTHLKTLCKLNGRQVKPNDDRIPALLDALDLKVEGLPFI